MATTTPMDAIDEELRAGEKRRRVGDSEPKESVPQLPIEMQLQMVKAVEAAQRAVLPPPSTRLIESAQIWRTLYGDWAKKRHTRMEHPPKLISLARARLFISPRFKLITGMQWLASLQILEAQADSLEGGSREYPFPFTVIYQEEGDPSSPLAQRWKFLSVSAVVRREVRTVDNLSVTTAITFSILRMVEVFGPDVEHSLATMPGMMRFSEFGPPVIDLEGPWPTVVRSAILYNRARQFITPSSYDMRIMPQILNALTNKFALDDRRFARPTAGMLSWKDVVVMVRVEAEDLLKELQNMRLKPPGNLQIDFYYLERDSTTGAEEEISTYVIVSDCATIQDLVTDSFRAVRRDLDSPGLERFNGASYHRVEIAWINGVRMALYDTRKLADPEVGFAFPASAKAVEVVRALVETLPEPALRPLAENPEWGYETNPNGILTSKFLPDVNAFGAGLLIMPAPWFFYFTIFFSAMEKIVTATHVFHYKVNTITMTTLDSPHILAHQPYEMIFLPDRLGPEDLEELTMLQRRDIEERATASLVEEGVELV